MVLNSVEKVAEQAQWLEGALAHNPCRWTVVIFHHPIFSGAKGRDNPKIRAAWKPVLDKHRVDLVLQGHDHVYARSNPNAEATRETPVYIISVAGPKMYDRGDRTWAERFAQDTQMYQVISVRGDVLRYEARTAAGELYDAFEIRKQGASVAVVPAKLGPERLRP